VLLSLHAEGRRHESSKHERQVYKWVRDSAILQGHAYGCGLMPNNVIAGTEYYVVVRAYG
jgi:hypothetical protein